MAQSVKTSDFSSGHDLTVLESSAASGSVLTSQNLKPALDSVSPSLSAPPPLVLSWALTKLICICVINGSKESLSSYHIQHSMLGEMV